MTQPWFESRLLALMCQHGRLFSRLQEPPRALMAGKIQYPEAVRLVIDTLTISMSTGGRKIGHDLQFVISLRGSPLRVSARIATASDTNAVFEKTRGGTPVKLPRPAHGGLRTIGGITCFLLMHIDPLTGVIAVSLVMLMAALLFYSPPPPDLHNIGSGGDAP